MPFPVDLTLITVSGLVVADSGEQARVRFAWPWLQGGDTVLAAGYLTLLGDESTGEFTVDLPATDDPAWSPQDFTIAVTITVDGRTQRGTIQLPYDGGPVDLADVFNPDDATEPGVTYALIGHTHPGGGEGGPIAIGDVTGLTAALAGKASLVHAHVVGDVTGLQAALDGKSATGHTHTTANVTGLDTALATLTAGVAAAATDVEVAAIVADVDGLDTRVTALEEAPGGGGTTLVVRRATVTGGNITPGASVPWVALSGGPTLALPAAVGDYVEFSVVSAMWDPGASFLDLAVVVGGAAVRYLSSDTATPAIEGAPPFYADPQTYHNYGPTFEFEVLSGDLSGGNVTVGFWTRGDGGGTLFASTNYPLRWRAVNHGPADVA